jgi:SWI/SNF-related matrix-associated actin-dependent regulator 1 of chromatin subfamily A
MRGLNFLLFRLLRPSCRQHNENSIKPRPTVDEQLEINAALWADVWDGLKDFGSWLSGKPIDPTPAITWTPALEDTMLKRTPRPYQLEGVERLDTFKKMKGVGVRAIVADEMGLGKSLLTLLWRKKHYEQTSPMVIVCPASLKYNWQRECRLVKIEAEVLETTRTRPLTSKNLIINYDILGEWLEHLKATNPQLIIMDESHYLASGKSQRTNNCRKLCNGVPNIIALSGTPLSNRPAELWPTLNILRPDLYPSMFDFGNQFCEIGKSYGQWTYSGAANLAVLHHRLKRKLMIRRTKVEVIEQLPPKIRALVPISLDAKGMQEYEFALDDFKGWLQTYDPEHAKSALRAEALVKVGYMKRLVAKLKLNKIIGWVEDFLEESDGKLILFAIHRDIAAAFHARWPGKSVLVTGSVTGRDRQHAADMFQTDPNIRLFIGNIRAAGVGLNLTAASTVAFAELGWTPAEHTQAEDRCYARIGDLHGANIYYLIAHGTVEERIAKLIGEKQERLDLIMDGKKVDGSLSVFGEFIRELKEEFA